MYEWKEDFQRDAALCLFPTVLCGSCLQGEIDKNGHKHAATLQRQLISAKRVVRPLQKWRWGNIKQTLYMDDLGRFTAYGLRDLSLVGVCFLFTV